MKILKIKKRINNVLRRFKLSRWAWLSIAIAPYLIISILAILNISIAQIINFIVTYSGQISLTVTLGYRIELAIEKQKLKTESKNIESIKKAVESELFTVQRTLKGLDKKVTSTREEHLEVRTKIETLLILLKMLDKRNDF